MDFLETTLARLSATRVPRYHPNGPAAAEPAALVALALLAHGRARAAREHVDRLLELQGSDGGVGIEHSQRTPGWPTPLAVLAWQAAQASSISQPEYGAAVHRGLRWILLMQGSVPEQVEAIGHDEQILGWPWVSGTHSWIEPTASCLLALKHSSCYRHSRAAHAVQLLVDRLLETGGCNYGNTIVFGQALRPHIQPTGITLLALAGEDDTTGRIGRSIDFLNSALSDETPTVSLCYGLLGLAANDAYPTQADGYLRAAAGRTLARDASSYKLALLALAALGPQCPLIARVRAFEAEHYPRSVPG